MAPPPLPSLCPRPLLSRSPGRGGKRPIVDDSNLQLSDLDLSVKPLYKEEKISSENAPLQEFLALEEEFYALKEIAREFEEAYQLALQSVSRNKK